MLAQVYSSSDIQLGTGLTVSTLGGVFSLPNPTTDSPDTFYLWVNTTGNPNLIHEGAVMFTFDPVSGDLLGQTEYSPGGLFSSGELILSQQGNLYMNSTSDVGLTYGLYQVSPYTLAFTGTNYMASFYLGGDLAFAFPALDETVGVLVNGHGSQADVYNLTTGALQYTIQLPNPVAALALGGQNDCFVLCTNGMVISFDYTTGNILTAARIPTPGGTTGGFGAETSIYWYPTMSWLMVCNNTGATTNIIGYSPVPQTDRATTPIPLQTPLNGNTIPVLTCIVDDLNMGLGGSIVMSTVTGSGSVVGIPVTDFRGRSQAQVLCSSVGSIAINCTASVTQTNSTGNILATLSASSTFNVTDQAQAVAAVSTNVMPAIGYPNGKGRLIHPTLGAFDYEYKPDQWVNMDGDVLVAPAWSSVKTLSGAASVLWAGNIRDTMCEERWTAQGGMSMPITQLRMLQTLWTNPIDPSVGYVQWYPSYANSAGYNVILVDLVCGSAGQTQSSRISGAGAPTIVLDDVVNYIDSDGDNIGWVSLPVTLFLKMVSKISG